MLIHDKEHQQAIVLFLLADAPFTKQVVGKVEDVVVAYRGQHYNSHLNARALLQLPQHHVDAVARSRREDGRRVGNILSIIFQVYVGHLVNRHCA